MKIIPSLLWSVSLSRYSLFLLLTRISKPVSGDNKNSYLSDLPSTLICMLFLGSVF